MSGSGASPDHRQHEVRGKHDFVVSKREGEEEKICSRNLLKPRMVAAASLAQMLGVLSGLGNEAPALLWAETPQDPGRTPQQS